MTEFAKPQHWKVNPRHTAQTWEFNRCFPATHKPQPDFRRLPLDKEYFKELLWIDRRLTTTLDELLTVRGLLDLIFDEFEKLPTTLNKSSPDARAELLFSCYRKLSNQYIQDLRQISIDLEHQIKKLERTTIEPPR
jgi:hypothetical protein